MLYLSAKLGSGLLNIFCSFILLRKGELVALLKLCSCYFVAIKSSVCLFLAVPWVGMSFATVAFPGHTHLLFNIALA